MIKRVLTLVFVACVSYALGTLSSLNAAAPVPAQGQQAPAAKVDAGAQVSQKLDQVLKNQEEMKQQLKRIFAKL
ncbi:MAG: hypothetical protein ACD_79C01014G0005 [uncultured bacterium]|nr:MAG: hypothetical protein ACD_79C01014G0005 [uncultured bacterium]